MSIPFSFSFSFLIRVYLPGLLLSVLLYPVVFKILWFFDFPDLFPFNYVLLEGLFLGIFLNLFGHKIYCIFVGRLLWPSWFFNKRRGWWDKYVKNLFEMIRMFEKENKDSSKEYREAWYALRKFPINGTDGYFAIYATKLGNIIHGYEDYPSSRYGLDGTWFWYRIWIKLDKDMRNEIDGISAKADLVVYSSFIFFISSFLFFSETLISVFIETLIIPSYIYGILFLVCLMLGPMFYVLACHLHSSYGEYYKSMFDLNKDIIKEVDNFFTEEEKERVDVLWRYLQYYKIRCKKCNELNQGNTEKCKGCGGKLPVIFPSKKKLVKNVD